MTRGSMNPGFDQRVGDWLEDDPDAAPQAVLETVLAAFPSIPQRRVIRAPWRPTPMTRLMVFGAAVVAVLIGGSLVVLRPGTTPATMPSTGPSASPSPSASVAAERALKLTGTYSSSLYGYSIAIDPSWTTTAATVPINDPASTDQTAYDAIRVTGTDTTIGVAAEPIGSSTFVQYLASQHDDVKKGDAPADCKGPDPAAWPPRSVGDREGRVMVLCNYEVVFVQSGDHVYQFTWGHASFDVSKHLSEADFSRVLATVAFSTGPSAAPSGSDRVYVSQLYHYRTRYPAAWTVQAGTQPNAVDHVPALEDRRADEFGDGIASGVMVTSAPASTLRGDLSTFSAFVAQAVTREFPMYHGQGCTRPTRTFVLDGEPAIETDFFCPAHTALWLTAIHDGRAYQVVWLDDGPFTPEGLRPRFDEFLQGFAFAP